MHKVEMVVMVGAAVIAAVCFTLAVGSSLILQYGRDRTGHMPAVHVRGLKKKRNIGLTSGFIFFAIAVALAGVHG